MLGGSFDPIHHGHLAVASEVASILELEHVVFVPVGIPWHKGPLQASAEDRYAMTVLATESDNRFSVSRVDVDRAGVTYTVDTLRDLNDEFRRSNPGHAASWFFITGADALADLQRWREPEEIFRMAHIVGVARPGHEAMESEVDSRAIRVEAPLLDISSTDIRERVRSGRPIRYLVPSAVASWIATHHLYHDGAS